jgi:hypothetical protein
MPNIFWPWVRFPYLIDLIELDHRENSGKPRARLIAKEPIAQRALLNTCGVALEFIDARNGFGESFKRMENSM